MNLQHDSQCGVRQRWLDLTNWAYPNCCSRTRYRKSWKCEQHETLLRQKKSQWFDTQLRITTPRLNVEKKKRTLTSDCFTQSRMYISCSISPKSPLDGNFLPRICISAHSWGKWAPITRFQRLLTAALGGTSRLRQCTRAHASTRNHGHTRKLIPTNPLTRCTPTTWKGQFIKPAAQARPRMDSASTGLKKGGRKCVCVCGCVYFV